MKKIVLLLITSIILKHGTLAQQKVIYDQPFSSISFWDVDTTRGIMLIQEGQAILTSKIKGVFDAAFHSGLAPDDNFSIEAKVTLPTDTYGAAGITFMKADDKNFYTFLVTTRNVFVLGAFQKGYENQIGQGTYSPDGKTLTLKIEKIDFEVYVYINKISYGKFSVGNAMGDMIGMAAGGNTDIRFNSLKVLRLDKTPKTAATNIQQRDYQIISQDDHTSFIDALAYSPDGKYIATGGNDNVVMIRNSHSGVIFKKFEGHVNTVKTLAFTPDCKYLLSGADDGFVIIWDIEKSKAIVTLKAALKYIDNLTISPDGKMAAFNSSDHDVSIMSVPRGEIIHNIDIEDGISCLKFTPDGLYLIAGTSYGNGYIWNVADWSLKSTSNNNLVKYFTLSPDGKYIFSSSGFRDTHHSFDISKIDISNGRFDLIKTNTGYGQIDCLALTPDEKLLLIGSEKEIKVIELPVFYHSKTFKPNFWDIKNIAISPDGKFFTFYAYTLQTWSLPDFKTISIRKNIFNENYSQSLSPDGKTLILGNKAWDFNTLTIHNNINVMPTSAVHAVGKNRFEYSKDGKMVADDNIIFDAPTFKPLGTYGESGATFVAFSNDGKLFAKGFADVNRRAVIEIWKIGKNKKPLFTIEHAGYLCSICFSPDAKFMLAGIEETIYLWEIKSGKNIDSDDKRISGHRGNVKKLVFSPDGKILASAGGANDYFIKLWDYNKRTEIATLGGHQDQVKDLAFEPGGKLLASVSDDKSTIIWDLKDFKPVKQIKENTGSIENVNFTPDGKYLITSSEDGSTIIYNMNNNEFIKVFTAYPDWLIIAPDGYFDGSAGCGKFAVISKGFDGYGPDLFALKFNRPDIILSRMELGSQELITHYYNMYKKRLRRAGLTEEQVSGEIHLPQAEIIDSKQEGKFLTVNFKISDNLYNLKNYNIFINDVPVYGAYGKLCNRVKIQEITEKIELSAGNNKIEISCTNEKGVESYRAITYAENKEVAKSNLYLLAFGVSTYKNPDYNLRYAHKDALDLEKVIQNMKGKGFDNVYTKILTNEQVTPEAIKASKDFVKNAKPDDTFILFIAGHGMHDKDVEATYYFLTSNADINNLKGTAADFETIEDLLQGIPPRNKLFLMDACESGEIDEETYETLAGSKTLSGLGIASRGFKATSSPSTVNAQPSAKRTYLYQKDRYIYNDLVRRSGAIVFSSSKGGELSYERSDIENGLFTEYIMKALTTTEADKDNNGFVSTDELRQYVSEQVAKASGDLQHPTVDRDNIYQKFGFQIK